MADCPVKGCGEQINTNQAACWQHRQLMTDGQLTEFYLAYYDYTNGKITAAKLLSVRRAIIKRTGASQ